MKRIVTVIFSTLLYSVGAAGEDDYAQKLRATLPELKMPPAWVTNHEPFQIIGNLYGVGGQDLAVYFIASDAGHILINTAAQGSIKHISANIDSLGSSKKEVKILLSMQSHLDHTAGLAKIRELTGAKMYATKRDAPILEDGGFSDPHFGGLETFRPVTVDKIVQDGEVIEIGNTRLKVHYHPGHKEGSSSYSMEVQENRKIYKVLIANMGTINPGKRMIINPTYPGVSEDFDYTYNNQKSIDIDIWVAAHKSQYDFNKKYQRGQPYNPEIFVDPEGFIDAIETLEIAYIQQVNAELKQKRKM